MLQLKVGSRFLSSASSFLRNSITLRIAVMKLSLFMLK